MYTANKPELILEKYCVTGYNIRLVTTVSQSFSQDTKSQIIFPLFHQEWDKYNEFILRSGSGKTETLDIKAEEDHPYLDIYIESWWLANMCLLNLLASGLLKREHVEFYLGYTTKIYEFTELMSGIVYWTLIIRTVSSRQKIVWTTNSLNTIINICL